MPNRWQPVKVFFMEPQNVYFFLKSFHLISMVAWFAALFYLPRLFVYMVEHPQAKPTLHIMAYKLSRYIMAPAMMSTWIFGLALLATQPYLLGMGWMHLKLTLVLALTAYHVSLEILRHQLEKNTCTKSGRFFRMYNEFPTLILITIVFLAVFKPF